MDRKHRNCRTKRNSVSIRSCWLKKEQPSGTNDINASEYLVEIKPKVIEQLKNYSQHNGNEQCGVLMGSQIDEKTFRISKVSPPCVAHNSKCGCERDAQKANDFIRKDYEESKHTRVYVGEWHTHPEPNPTPSPTDISSIISNYNGALLAVPFLMMIIVGTGSLYCSVYNGNNFVVMSNIDNSI